MQDWLAKLVDITAIGNNQSTLKDALAGVAGRFGFIGYAFVNLRPGQAFAVSNYHPDWQTTYDKKDYRFIDPVMRQAQRIRRAFSWSGEAEKASLSREERNFFSAAGDYNIRSGISMPIATPNGGMSMLTFASDRLVAAGDGEIDAIAAASAVAQLHARFEYLKVSPSIEEKVIFSPKEATYARWLSYGKTVEDAADLEKVKYNTVRIAMEDVRRRYNLCNNTELVALAIRRGII